MFGRPKKKELISRRHTQSEMSESSFDMASFRRGTTLNSFNSNDTGQTERQRLKRLRIIRRRMVAALIIVVLVLVSGLAILSQFTNSISTVTVNNEVELSQADQTRYRQLVGEYFNQNSSERFSFIRRNSVLLQYVESKAPEVSAIKLVSSGIASSRLDITFREPVAMWVNGNDTSYVDSSGVVFTKNYYAVPTIVIEDNSGIQMTGGVATSAKFLSFVGKTAVAIEQNDGLKVARVVIPQGSARYVEFYLEGRNYPFKAQITRDAISQAHDIAVMVRYIDGRNITPRYVDCRVEGKAYWK
ncbi:MAG: hypothetical protein Q4C83_02870 [Candidatus Saccharibacteria bacterium]|nr:hypothetical protein [Candidatus Saccharibacteria bacterium]